MRSLHSSPLVAFLLSLLFALPMRTQQAASPPLPEIPQLMNEVHEHQKQLDKVRENYTYSVSRVVQEIDAKGQVSKTESEEAEVFFVNGQEISRSVKKDGKPLTDEEQNTETEHVTRLVEKAEKTPPDQHMGGHAISVGRLLEIMDVRNERRENYRGRPTIIFDFVGRKEVQTHGKAEDVSKDLQGTIWIDEADRQVARMEASFDDNFHIGGGIIANVQKGSRFNFDQAPVNGEIWLPSGVDATVQVRVMMLKTVRRHFTERDYDYKRFHVDAQQGKGAKIVPEDKP